MSLYTGSVLGLERPDTGEEDEYEPIDEDDRKSDYED
ncbi:hypothetical protein SAMN05216219_1591 [Mycetocola miduiensis]|uniref:Uncharacterized protein n=1 Tax=Mycetocola miduiensis TaxID=995034 RepID=A0A1I5AX21_9MICO|nr:hypothetical protein SAMN05216219_1591 [Mycetocola miduiensis]